nr:uncharacterized protein LOC119169804 [Rhipicephalus microplus]
MRRRRGIDAIFELCLFFALPSCFHDLIHGWDFLSRHEAIIDTTITHTIDTGSHSPLRQRPYRVSTEERRVITEQVDDMLGCVYGPGKTVSLFGPGALLV